MPRLKKPLYEKETFEYEVIEGDTLISIASKFDIRVSILKQINRLLNDFVFPKDVLFIPKDRTSIDFHNSKSSEESGSTSSEYANLIQENTVNHDDYIIDFKKKIFSIKDAKYITEDEGIVFGSLLLSTSVVMFEASSLDPLVIEFGHDRYSVIIPYEFIVRYQIVDNNHFLSDKKSNKGSTTFRLKLNESKSDDSDCVFMQAESQLLKSNDALDTFIDSSSIPADNILLGKISPSSRENRGLLSFPGTPGSFKLSLLSRRLGSISEFGNVNENNSKNLEKINFSEIKKEEMEAETTDGKKSCPATPIDIPRSANTSTSSPNDQKISANVYKDDSVGSSANFAFPMSGASFVYPEGFQIYLDLNNEIFSHDPNDRGRQTKDLADLPPLDLMSSSKVSVDSVLDFGSPVIGSPCAKFNVDHLSEDEEDAAEDIRSRHNSAQSQPILFNPLDLSKIRVSGMRGNFQSFLGPSNMPALFKDYNMALKKHDAVSELPWYLIIECGLPLKALKNVPRSRTGEFIDCLKPMFMFTVKHDKVADLYTYLIRNFPEQYGNETEVTRVARGFDEPEDLKVLIETKSLSRKNSNNNNEAPEALSDFLDLSHVMMPVMSHISDILIESQIKMLVENLPSQHCIDQWLMTFSSEIHGTSLLSMFRSVESFDSSCLIVIKDNHSQVFGALCSHIPKLIHGFYGDGRTFLFSFRKKFQIYKWSEFNSNLILATKESLCIGAADGRFGLYIDGDLNHGRTQNCQTFGNEPLTETEDFFIRVIEVWVFKNK